MKIYTNLDVDGDILLSGRLYKYYRTSSSIPMILAGSNNRNITLLRVSSSSITGWATGGRSAYGFSLKYTGYTGKGEGVDNNLVLYADNQDNEAQNIAIAVNQTGQVGIRADPSTSYSLYVNGDANISGTLYQGGTAVSLTGHVHNYAGSSSVGGAATSAVKLATARTITLTGNVTGSGTFDGSGDLTIDVQPKVAYPSQSGTVKDELAWQRIATMELPAEHIGNSKYTIILDIMPDVTSIAGRLTASISYNGDDTPTTTGTPVFRWDWCNSTIDPAQWIIAYTVTADDTYPRQAEIWCYNKYYGSHHIVQVDTYIREGGEDIWDLKTNKDDILKKPSWKDAPGRTATDEGATQVINGVTVKWKALTSSRGVLANNTTGNAATATALTSNAGNTYLPVYFTGGRPVACTVKNNNNGTLGYGGSENSALITVTTLSFWNGTYSAGSSNLRYAVPPLADGAAQSGTGKPCKPIATTDYAQHQVTYSSEVPDSGNEGDVCFIPDDHEERIQELEAKADGLSTGSGSLGNSLAELSGRMTAAEGGISGLQSDMQGKVDAVSGMGLSHVDVTTSMTDVWDGKQDAIPAGTYAPYCSDGYLPLTGGEVSGNLTIGGSLYVQGDSKTVIAEKVESETDYIYLRKNNASALTGYSGLEVLNYDGKQDNLRLVVDGSGTARVGDIGQEQPLLTRAETGALTSGNVLKWDGTRFKAVDSGFTIGKSVPSNAVFKYNAGYGLNESGDTFNLRYSRVGHAGNDRSKANWYKVASISHPNTYSDYTVTFSVWAGYSDDSTKLGTLSAHIRTNSASADGSRCQLVWLNAASGINCDHFVMLYTNDGVSSANPQLAEIWTYCNTDWQAHHFDVISEGTRTSESDCWTLADYVNDAAKTGSTFYGTASTLIEQQLALAVSRSTETGRSMSAKVSVLSVLKNDTSGNAATATHARGIIPVRGTGTAVGVWTASCDQITSYYDGLTIAYYINIAGAATTTLNINGLGAVQVYRDASALTTHLPVGTVVLLTYSTMSGGARWHWADYDANNYAYARFYNLTSTDYNKDYYLAVNYTSGDSMAAGKNANRYCGHSTLVKLNPNTGNITAPTFTGDLVGTATKATNDKDGNPIDTTYLKLAGGSLTGRLTVSSGGLHAVGLDSDATGNGAQLRIVGGNYGYMVRNDGNATYGLMTSQNSPYGGWTTARPWVISNSDGVMSINGNANTATYLSGDNMSGTLTISKSNWTGGRPADGDVRVWSQKWVDSGLGTDTADLNIWLHKVSDSAVTANLSIDGQIYAMGGFVGHASSDLPLTGGTLTGDLVLSGDRQVKNKVDNSLLRIQGGSAENKGARIVLSGKDRTNYQGVAEIIAHDGTNSSTFTLNANGDANLNRGLFVANRVVAKDYTYKLSSEPTGDDLYVWSNARYEMHGSDGKCIAYLRPQIGTQENSLVLNIANKTSTASGSFKLWSNGNVWTQGFIDSSGDIRSYKNAPCIYLQNKAFDMETTNYADGDTLSMFYFRDAAGRPLAVLENAPHRHIEDDGAVRTHNVLRMTVRKPDNSGWMSTPLYIGWGSATGNNNYEYCSLPMATVSATTSEGVALYLRNKSNNGVARQVFLERSNNGWTGMVESQWGTDGKKHIRMKTHSEKSNTWDYVGITGNTSSESTAFTTHCPTPPSTSDTTEIATTEWVNDKVFGGEFQVESPNPAGSNVYRKIYECDFSGILAWHTWMLDFDVYDAWYSTTMTATYHVQIHSNSTAGQIVVSGASPPTPQISCVGHHGTSVLGVGDVILAYSNTDKKAQVWIHVTASQSQFVFKRNVSSDRSAVNHKVWTACPSASWTSSLPDEDKYTYIYATQIFERPITYESSVPSAGDEGDVCFIPDDHEDRISALETELFNNTVDQSVQYQRKIIYGTSSTPPSGCSEGDIYIQIQE